jgi:hypothetical protein
MDYHQNARLTRHSREQMAKMVIEQGAAIRMLPRLSGSALRPQPSGRVVTGSRARRRSQTSVQGRTASARTIWTERWSRKRSTTTRARRRRRE